MDYIISAVLVFGVIYWTRSLFKSHAGNDLSRKILSVYATLLLIGFLIASLISLFLPELSGFGSLFIGCFSAWILATIGERIATSAERKGRSWSAFYWMSVLLSPIISVIIVATLPSGKNVPGPVNDSRPDEIENIRRLAQLRDDGILTEDEFQAKKKSLLNGLEKN
jgi:hypothetical protein